MTPDSNRTPLPHPQAADAVARPGPEPAAAPGSGSRAAAAAPSAEDIVSRILSRHGTALASTAGEHEQRETDDDGALEREARAARRAVGPAAGSEDVSEVEYRRVRLERVVLVGLDLPGAAPAPGHGAAEGQWGEPGAGPCGWFAAWFTGRIDGGRPGGDCRGAWVSPLGAWGAGARSPATCPPSPPLRRRLAPVLRALERLLLLAVVA